MLKLLVLAAGPVFLAAVARKITVLVRFAAPALNALKKPRLPLMEFAWLTNRFARPAQLALTRPNIIINALPRKALAPVASVAAEKITIIKTVARR